MTHIHESALLSQELTLENGVSIAQGVVFASQQGQHTILRENVRIGAGAVIGAGVEVGWGAQVRPGCVVLDNVPANAIVEGNPASIVGYANAAGQPSMGPASAPTSGAGLELGSHPLGVGKAALHVLPKVVDLRGSLSVGEFSKDLPFDPARYFLVFDVPSRELRGEHAHYACAQFLICVHGSCRALLDDGTKRREVVLDRPELGLYMPNMIWGTQYEYSPDAVLLVLASHPYDNADYMRTYDAFRAALQGKS